MPIAARGPPFCATNSPSMCLRCVRACFWYNRFRRTHSIWIRAISDFRPPKPQYFAPAAAKCRAFRLVLLITIWIAITAISAKRPATQNGTTRHRHPERLDRRDQKKYQHRNGHDMCIIWSNGTFHRRTQQLHQNQRFRSIYGGTWRWSMVARKTQDFAQSTVGRSVSSMVGGKC